MLASLLALIKCNALQIWGFFLNPQTFAESFLRLDTCLVRALTDSPTDVRGAGTDCVPIVNSFIQPAPLKIDNSQILPQKYGP